MPTKGTPKRSAKRVARFEYSEAPGCQVRPATGAFGAITPAGWLHVEFFIDLPMHPDTVDVPLDTEGSLDLTASLVRPNAPGVAMAIQREVQARLAIPGSQLRNIGKWFLSRAEDWERTQTSGASNGEADHAED